MRADQIVLQEFGNLGIHQHRLRCIAKVTMAVLTASRLALTSVGRALGGMAKPKYGIKCVDRFLGNVLLFEEIALFHRRLAQLIPLDERPVLLIDWTDIGTLWTALVVTLVTQGRGLTLCWEAHPRSQVNSPRVESAMLKKLTELLPAGCKPILVSDAGFRGPWLNKVVEKGWDFVGRVRGRVHVKRVGSTRWLPVKCLWSEASARPRDLGLYSMGHYYLPVEARLVTIWKNKRKHSKELPRIGRRKKRRIRCAREPWVLATTLLEIPLEEVIRLYGLRMRIELTFRDQKCPRFEKNKGDRLLYLQPDCMLARRYADKVACPLYFAGTQVK